MERSAWWGISEIGLDQGKAQGDRRAKNIKHARAKRAWGECVRAGEAVGEGRGKQVKTPSRRSRGGNGRAAPARGTGRCRHMMFDLELRRSVTFYLHLRRFLMVLDPRNGMRRFIWMLDGVHAVLFGS